MSRLRSTLLAALLCPLFCTGQLFALAYDVSDWPSKAFGAENRTVEIASTDPHQAAIDVAVAKTSPTSPDASNTSRNPLDAVAESLGGTVDGLMRFLGGTVDGLGRSIEGTVNGLGQFLGDSGETVVEVVEGAAYVAAFTVLIVFYGMAYHGCNH